MTRQRETWLDGLKGFAILLVVLGHVLSGYLDAWTYPEAFTGFYHVRNWIYSFHMPLFFIISGYTFTLAYYREGKLRKSGFFRQMLNLFWMYVLFCLLQWWVKLLVPDLVNQAYTEETIRNMFREPLGNYWYIYVLFLFYGVAALVRLPGWHPMWGLLLGGISVLAAWGTLEADALTLYRFLYHLSFFFLGTVLCRHREVLKNQKIAGLCAMFLADAFLLYVFLRARNWYGNWKFMIALATSLVMLYQFFNVRRLAEFPLFRLCGKYSLEIYLLHTFFTAGLRTLIPLWGITAPWVSVGLNFVISTGLSLLIAYLAGKTRFMDVVFRPARFIRRICEKKEPDTGKTE